MPNVVGMEHCDDPDTPRAAKKRGRKKSRLTQLLKNRDHELYEIWNENTAESVFFSGKPSEEEVLEICKLEWWPEQTACSDDSIKAYIKEWVHVEPLKHVYAPQFSR